MRILFLTLLFLLPFFKSFGQTKHPVKANYECIQRFNLNAQQRLTKYPFNKAEKVKLVSILKLSDTASDIAERPVYQIPITNDSLISFNVKSVITLGTFQIDKLTDILYNYGIKGNQYKSSISTAVGLDGIVLFTDSKDKIVEFIEICFECGETVLETSKTRKNIGIPCNQKLQMLKTFFIDSGIIF